jgi:hypothetical protein
VCQLSVIQQIEWPSEFSQTKSSLFVSLTIHATKLTGIYILLCYTNSKFLVRYSSTRDLYHEIEIDEKDYCDIVQTFQNKAHIQEAMILPRDQLH